MASEIIDMIGYPKKKSPLGNGDFNRFEMLALYRFVKSHIDRKA
jgi:hypothetical protein